MVVTEGFALYQSVRLSVDHGTPVRLPEANFDPPPPLVINERSLTDRHTEKFKGTFTIYVTQGPDEIEGGYVTFLLREGGAM